MRILVVYASRHGATKGIAERIAATLQARSFEVTLRSVDQAGDLAAWDAFVIGSAAYAFHWVKASTELVRRNRALLATRPVWLFSSGPLGVETTDAQGRDLRTVAEPREFAELRAAIRPRGDQVFFGAYDPTAMPIGLMERFTRLMPATRTAMPSGDFRDWSAIEAWAATIADDLKRASAAAG